MSTRSFGLQGGDKVRNGTAQTPPSGGSVEASAVLARSPRARGRTAVATDKLIHCYKQLRGSRERHCMHRERNASLAAETEFCLRTSSVSPSPLPFSLCPCVPARGACNSFPLSHSLSILFIWYTFYLSVKRRSSYIKDGECDVDLNNAECMWDGGDCEWAIRNCLHVVEKYLRRPERAF